MLQERRKTTANEGNKAQPYFLISPRKYNQESLDPELKLKHTYFVSHIYYITPRVSDTISQWYALMPRVKHQPIRGSRENHSDTFFSLFLLLPPQS